MPFLRFHAIEKEKLARVSERLISEIVNTLGCPRETVVLEVMTSSFVTGNDHLEAYPFVKVEYFERPKEQQDAVAEIIYKCLRDAGYPDSDVCFSFLSPEHYYENGKIIK